MKHSVGNTIVSIMNFHPGQEVEIIKDHFPWTIGEKVTLKKCYKITSPYYWQVENPEGFIVPVDKIKPIFSNKKPEDWL